ncbi:hypothetical protein DFH27DRAFT_611078 [Peziza echinospora]|nr:hypothetical protein DFH27DRAFT_611078 [Peziza echinospora]
MLQSYCASSFVRDLITAIKKVPQYLGWLTVFHVGFLNTQLKYQPSAPLSPTSPTATETTLLSQLSESSLGDDYMSPFERIYFSDGIAEDPPHLFQRSDLMERPFPIPEDRPT